MTARAIHPSVEPAVAGAGLHDGAVIFYVDTADAEAARTRAALHLARDRAAEQGVTYRDELTRAGAYPGSRLVIDARASLADLDPSVLADGSTPGRRGHALVVIRARRRVLLREWQDAITGGSSQSLEDWLRSSDARSPDGTTQPRLRSRQRAVLEWWVEQVGAERVTVVVPCAEHLNVLRALEELAGLDTGTLPDATRRRALTLGEIEVIRALHVALDAPGAALEVDRSLVGSWASTAMAARDPGAGEPTIGMPVWAEERMRDETAALIATLSASATKVVGSLACLSEGSDDTAGETAMSADLPSEAAGPLALGLMDGLRLGRDRGTKPSIESREFAAVPASRLVAELAARPARALSGAFNADPGRGPVATDTNVTGGQSPTERAQRALPRGTRLLHIGPSKTGTTALQAALDRAREAALRQGVRYVGWRRHARAAVLEATGNPSRAPSRARREWRAIVEELRTATEPRTVFSSEELAHGDSAFVRRFVRQIGSTDVHVAVTLRPLARILPSVWQEGVKAGSVTPFETWLQKVLTDPETAPKLWRRHRHDELIKRWASVVGADRVTAIVVDDRDQSSLPIAFEGLLGLEPGTLQLHRDRSNRSLTLGEIEAVRAVNSQLERQGFDREFRRVLVGLGVSYRMRLRDPGPGEARIRLPSWAADTVSQISRAIVEEIAGSGVRVIGDLEALIAFGPAIPSDPDVPARVPPAAAAAMAIGVLEAARAVTLPDSAIAAGGGSDERDWIAAKLSIVPMRELARLVGRRAQRSGMSFVRRAAGSLPRGLRIPG